MHCGSWAGWSGCHMWPSSWLTRVDVDLVCGHSYSPSHQIQFLLSHWSVTTPHEVPALGPVLHVLPAPDWLEQAPCVACKSDCPEWVLHTAQSYGNSCEEAMVPVGTALGAGLVPTVCGMWINWRPRASTSGCMMYLCRLYLWHYCF